MAMDSDVDMSVGSGAVLEEEEQERWFACAGCDPQLYYDSRHPKPVQPSKLCSKPLFGQRGTEKSSCVCELF